METNREPKSNTIKVKVLSMTAITCTTVETLSRYTRERSRPTNVGDFWLHQKHEKARYSQRWIEQPFAARGKERRKERGKEGLKFYLKIIIILILTVNSDKNRI